MKKPVIAGICIAIGLIALASVFSIMSSDVETTADSTQVDLSDEITVISSESKSFDVDLSENLDVGDIP
jgi:hypothetical protein|tara:strand:+ start:392 stop:598 length:207 start_codon:yes stop_codon:yes gene_type:complete